MDSQSKMGVSQLLAEVVLTGASPFKVEPLLSDADGRIRIDAAGAGGAQLRLNSCGYRFVPQGEEQISIWWGAGAIEPITLLVEPFGKFQVRLKYADGVPYSGEVEILFGYGYSRKLMPDDRGIITFDTRLDGVAIVLIESRRPSYCAVRERISLEKPALSPIEIVLPAGDTGTGTLEIDLGLFASDSEYDIVVKPGTPPDYPLQNRPNWFAHGAKGGEVYTSKPLPAGEYFVRVLSRQVRPDVAGVPFCIATQTALIQIEAGQSKHIKPVPRSSYAARVRIVDEQGAPISPAVLGIKSEAYHRWPMDDYKPGRISAVPVCGYADADGVAVAVGICVEVRVLTVEAPGFELQDIEVNPSEGAVVDAGVVVLRKAQGVIELQLEGEGTGNEAEYEIQLLQPLGQVVYEPKTFKGRSFRVEGLPLRKYTISITDLSGRTAAYSQNVELSATRPIQVARFSMRKWPFDEDEK